MPSKLSIHLGSYPNNAFDVLERMQPGIVKVFNQSSEMNIDEIRRRCPNTLIVYRHYSDWTFADPAERFFESMRDTFNKLRGRGIVWEGINEPILETVSDARALNRWIVRFAQLLHAEGELIAGFSWSTGNPTPDKLPIVLPHLIDAAAAVDLHAFHEYYKQNGQQADWRRYREFERALPAHARKPVVITEAGWDDNGDPLTGGYRGKVSDQQYVEILKQYDAVLLQDPYVLGATVFQWGDGWPSFDLTSAVNLLTAYVQQAGGGLVTPKPWPLPNFGPTFVVAPQTISAGQNATLRWDADNTHEVLLDGQRVDAHGAKTIAPTQTATYTLKITFNDGTTQTLTTTLTVTLAGAAQIKSVTFSPTTLRPGGLLNVSITVVNGTASALPTQGPNPGFVYEESDTFRSRGFSEASGAYRVGVGLDAGTAVDHPYRWGFGAPLAPGQSVTVTGAIRLTSTRAVKFWVGLVREKIAWLQDRQGEQMVTVGGAGVVEITSVSLTPATVSAGGLLNVSITVKNGTADTLPTQGPDPGFVYEEGDTFRSRGFTETSGPYRVGIDFDGRGTFTVDHPYRWGLGAPLAPGQTATITGAIRLETPRAISYWAGLVREKIAWVQDKQGAQKITVTATPAPTLSFTATPTVIAPGQSSKLEWNVTGARTVTLDGQTVAAQGSRPITPARTTTYTLRVGLNDGSARDLTATVTVSTQSPPTRPPTVTITPENVAHLKTFPRPANDNGRGLHFHIDLRESTIAAVVPQLLSIGCRWTMIYAPDENQAQRAARGCWNAGIMPIIRIGKRVDEPFDPVVYVTKLKAIGAPPYVQIYNEPGDDREWKKWPGSNWAGIFGARWAQAAIAVYDAGGYPGLQVLGREEFVTAVDSVAAQGRTDIWRRAFFALHNYAANHPPNYPYDALTNKTIFEDDVAVLVFLEYAAWMKEKIGFVLPIIGGEGGWQFGAHEDQRYPKVEPPLHARYHAEMFDWFRTGLLSNGEPLPDYLFSIAPWIAGGWGGDDWWGGPLGDKTETINAVRALPAFTRKFSWDGGAVPIPTYSFTATPNAITAGQSAKLEWSVTNATQVTLNSEAVALSGSRTVSPAQTTTYVLRMVFANGTTKDVSATVTVSPSGGIPALQWDARLDALGVKLVRVPDAHAWRLTAAVYQDETQSGGNHNIYFKLLRADGTPAAGVKIIVDWKDRPPQDDPAYVTTDANGETNCPLWAILHPELQDGPYFTKTVNEPSDVVSGMGLPVNRHVNFLLTYKFV